MSNTNNSQLGKWILEREPNNKPYCFHCSVCDDDFAYVGINTAWPYCPLCGSKMDDTKVYEKHEI